MMLSFCKVIIFADSLPSMLAFYKVVFLSGRIPVKVSSCQIIFLSYQLFIKLCSNSRRVRVVLGGSVDGWGGWVGGVVVWRIIE